MLRVFAITQDLQLIDSHSIDVIKEQENINWFWVDFIDPDDSEIELLDTYFHFHPLSIEDSIYSFNKPKLDYYDDYSFFIFNALHQSTLEPIEVSLFLHDNYIVSFHRSPLNEIDQAWDRVKANKGNWNQGPSYIAHQILDKIVDSYFPAIYMIEDFITKLENNVNKLSIHQLLSELFEIRTDLIKLRRIVNSMRDLLYRILNSDRLKGFTEHKLYFSDIYDHLLKLSDMVDSSREVTADMRDSYMSISSNRMNTNMMILTVITTIFIPLTFIAGVYGMNFKYMPELEWEYGYFIVLGAMIAIAVLMYLWFKRKGWFDI